MPAFDIVQSAVMRVAIGADHAGFPLKEHLKDTLQRLGHAVDDLGTREEQPVALPPRCVPVQRALYNDLFTGRMSRAHNDANVVSLGGRIVAFGLADEIVALWLDTAFEGG